MVEKTEGYRDREAILLPKSDDHRTGRHDHGDGCWKRHSGHKDQQQTI